MKKPKVGDIFKYTYNIDWSEKWTVEKVISIDKDGLMLTETLECYPKELFRIGQVGNFSNTFSDKFDYSYKIKKEIEDWVKND